MGLFEQAKQDIQQITSNTDEWGIDLEFIAPNGTIANIVGIHTKHHLGIDTDGNRVNTKNVSISFSEQLLVDVNYPLRDANNNVNLAGHKLRAIDSTGVLNTYIINQWFPDESIGLIVCILNELES